MQGFTEISSKQDFDALLASIAGLHDSLTKELHLLNRGYVDANARMTLSHRFDVQLLLQSQWPPHALELVFVGVDDLQLGGAEEYWGATVDEVRGETTDERRLILRADDHLRISGRRVFYRVREDALGQRAFLGDEIPSPDAVAATLFDGEWRQCGACADAWREEPTVVFARCPSCGRLTELTA